MQKAFVVNVGALRHGGVHAKEAHCAGPLADLRVTATRVPPGGEIRIDALLEVASGSSILVSGAVAAPWEGDCRRCLGPATGTLTAEVRELYEERPNPETPDESYKLKGDELDLEPLVRDAVLLELPQAPLCSEACAGLCPECGIDRNKGTCSCETEATDPRWAALDVLRAED